MDYWEEDFTGDDMRLMEENARTTGPPTIEIGSVKPEGGSFVARYRGEIVALRPSRREAMVVVTAHRYAEQIGQGQAKDAGKPLL